MLEPQSRTLLLDALRPPPGYRLDFAAGTTFSLDLVAMLAAPLAFALLDREGPDGRLIGDPLALLEALRRNAGRLAVFCQSGRISIPRPDRLLLSYLERSVVEVKAPIAGGVFHPKVWVLRFAADNQPVIYRVLCGSRNLTFDRSWDTALILEGTLIERRNAYAANHPLGDFLAALPGLAIRQVPPGLSERIEQMQAEVRKVSFDFPEGFEGYAFYPMGIEGYRSLPFKGKEVRIDDLLIVSPFVSAGGLDALKKCAGGNVRLVSRLEELQALDPAVLKGIEPINVFSDEQVDEEPIVEESGPREGIGPDSPPELSGLHAKLFVADAGWNAYVWTGSANATDAAFKRNVEFLVALTGKKKSCGIAAFLNAGEGDSGFSSFLKTFVPTATEHDDAGKKVLEEKLDEARRAIASALMEIRAAEDSAGAAWTMTLAVVEAMPEVAHGLRVRSWPITCKPASLAQSLEFAGGAGEIAEFRSLSFEALTSFIAFEIAIPGQSLVSPVQFVLNLPAVGFPEDRANRLLLKMLGSGDAVLRYVQLLLSRSSAAGGEESAGFELTGGAGNARYGQDGQTLLEPLMRALHTDRNSLDDVARLVADLRNAGTGSGSFPPGFEEIWEPIWEARQRLGDEKSTA